MQKALHNIHAHKYAKSYSRKYIILKYNRITSVSNIGIKPFIKKDLCKLAVRKRESPQTKVGRRVRDGP